MITEKLISQDSSECQILRVPAHNRVIAVSAPDWQLLFNSKSAISLAFLTVKIGADYNPDSFDSFRLVSYLYTPRTGSIAASSSCKFDIYKVVNPSWSDVPILSLSGSYLPNSYYYVDVPISSLGVDLLGETSLMVECTITRLKRTYRDRIYFNNLGIFGNCFRLKQDIDYLDITKLDE